MNDADIFDLIPAYALGALSDEERQLVDGLLARSPEARAELRSYTDMLVGMSALTPRQAAPAHLNADFKARLAAETPVIRPSGINITPFRVLLGLAAMLVLVFGIYLAYRAAQPDPVQQQIAAVMNDPNATTTDLAPLNNSTGKVQIVTAPNATNAVVVADLPVLPADQQYQMWMIVDNKPESMGVFTAGGTNGQYLLAVPTSPANIDFVFGLTVEPAGGSDLPTTSPIFAAEVKQTSMLFPALMG